MHVGQYFVRCLVVGSVPAVGRTFSQYISFRIDAKDCFPTVARQPVEPSWAAVSVYAMGDYVLVDVRYQFGARALGIGLCVLPAYNTDIHKPRFEAPLSRAPVLLR